MTPAYALTKRLFSWSSWRRKRSKHHKREILDAITTDIAAYGPDHLVITGDLINFAADKEFAAARAWLQSLGDARDVTVTPGNHDALAGCGTFDPWAEWLEDELTETFPKVRVRGEVAVICVNTGLPTAPFLATGTCGEDQLARLGPILDDLKGRGLFRVIAIHHPPTPGGSPRKALTDQKALREVLGVHGAELILHGHTHVPLLGAVKGPDGPIPAVCAPSASQRPVGKTNAARWHGIEIEKAADGWSVRVEIRGFAPDGVAVEGLGQYRLDV
ncbi:metallophosphoesterase [Caulobacter sp. 73W]|uniref:Metallophosphoesterase n=1 Tax=Caulobacter sp. 73W TaxID=3161137 RepID=A0AB39KQ63_9CAUL